MLFAFGLARIVIVWLIHVLRLENKNINLLVVRGVPIVHSCSNASSDAPWEGAHLSKGYLTAQVKSYSYRKHSLYSMSPLSPLHVACLSGKYFMCNCYFAYLDSSC